jgi:hypothetical protein
MSRMGDVEDIRTLSKLQLKQISFKIWRYNLISGSSTENLPIVHVEPNVLIPKFKNIRLGVGELEANKPRRLG